MRDILKLPFHDVGKCVEMLRKIREEKRNRTSTIFVILSVIYTSKRPFNYSSVRSVYSAKERIEQTAESIKSIRKQCPSAKILLIEGGRKDISEDLEKMADFYLYVGNDKHIRNAVDSKYKGWGEIEMLMKAFPYIKEYEYMFKLSGRYELSDRFQIDNFDEERINFKNYVTGRAGFPCGESRYIKGSHSTRLYGVPQKYYNVFFEELKKAKFSVRCGKGIENVIGSHIKKDIFFYVEELGVKGKIGVNGEVIEE